MSDKLTKAMLKCDVNRQYNFYVGSALLTKFDDVITKEAKKMIAKSQVDQFLQFHLTQKQDR